MIEHPSDFRNLFGSGAKPSEHFPHPQFSLRHRINRTSSRYADAIPAKVSRLEGRIATAAERVEREAAEYEQHRNQSFVRLGTSVLGALLDRAAQV